MTETYQLHRTWPMARLPLDAEIRAKNIVEQLGGVWRGTRGECRCPAHDDGSPSLSVRLGDSAILFHCFAGCTALEVLKALQRRKLHDRAAVAMPEGKPKRDMGALALRLWNASLPIAGTLAEDYLVARGLTAPYPKGLRFNPATIFGSGTDRRVMPAMIAAVEKRRRSGRGATDLPRFRAMCCESPSPSRRSRWGCSVQQRSGLRPRPHELGLAEGIEDALSATQWFGTPTWALGGVERLAFVAIPEKVRRVIVYGDRGRAAERLLEKGTRSPDGERARTHQPRARAS